MFQPELLSLFVQKMVQERDGALQARTNLDGIWEKAREQYQGVDEINRERGWTKPADKSSGLISTLGRAGNEDRSTVFLNITRPYVNAGVSRVTDILLPVGNKMPWGLKQTPVSELAILESVLEDYPDLSSILPPELATRLGTRTGESLELARQYIADALVETKWTSAIREQIAESGLVGTGILKGPFPKRRILSPDLAAMFDQIESTPEMAVGLATLKLRLSYHSAAECIKVENFFPDPACGSDIHNGKFVWERIPDQSERQLLLLAEDETYFADQIAAAIEEKPKDKHDTKSVERRGFTIWFRTGLVNLSGLDGEESCLCFRQLTFVNDRLIKIAELPLDSELFPYRLLKWEPRPDSWDGIGIAEQIETPQRGLNTAVRAGNDNLAFSVGFMILVREGLVEPFPGDDWVLRPYKKLRVIADQLAALTGKEVRPEDAFKALEFPNHLSVILPWIEFWLRMAEQTSGLPLLLQGQTSSDSVGVTQQLMSNATSNLRLLIGRWDEEVCAPFIQDCYSWVQKYGPEKAKGDGVAFALGSATLIVRETQLQGLMQFGDRVIQPQYGKSPKKWANLLLESFQVDPEVLSIGEEEQTQLEAAANQPDPTVEVANIKAQTDLAISQMQMELQKMKLGMDMEKKQAEIAHGTDVAETQLAGQIATTAMKRDGDLQKEHLKVVTKSPAPPASPAPVEKKEEEMSVESAMDILGL
jgi:hypothetical protein